MQEALCTFSNVWNMFPKLEVLFLLIRKACLEVLGLAYILSYSFFLYFIYPTYYLSFWKIYEKDTPMPTYSALQEKAMNA